MTLEEVHVVTVHCHYEIPKGSLIGQAGDSGLLPLNILQVIRGPQNQGGPGLCTPHLQVPQSYNEDQDILIQLGSTPPLDKVWHSGAGSSGETRDDC